MRALLRPKELQFGYQCCTLSTRSPARRCRLSCEQRVDFFARKCFTLEQGRGKTFYIRTMP